MWAVLALDLSADTALFKLRKIHHYQISGGMFIKLSEGATADKSRAIITHVFHFEHTDHALTGHPFMVRTWLRESYRQIEQKW